MLEKNDVIGNYKLVQFLGKGQFGEVWLAEKTLQFSTRKFRHALKFMSNRTEEINLNAAEAEIDTWIKVSGHPNVMPVLDMLLYREYIIIISEYADGGSLKNWLRQNGGKAPSPEKALEIMLGILRGIEHLHSRSVVHRDLKPDNILLQGNFPRITDFGISRIVSEISSLTKAIGSPAYMSPESFHGNKSPQTDIWSAGVIMYEMLAGELPFEGETIFALRDSIQQDKPKSLSKDISEELKYIVENALQKERARRFQTASELRSAIEKALYKLRAETAYKTVISTDSEKILRTKLDSLHTTEPTINFIDAQRQKSESIVAKLPEKESEPVITQSKIENLPETLSSQIEETKYWKELERKEREKEATAPLKLNQETKKSLVEMKGGNTIILVTVIGGVLGLLIALLIARWMIGFSTFTSANLSQNIPANISQNAPTNVLDNISANISAIAASPTLTPRSSSTPDDKHINVGTINSRAVSLSKPAYPSEAREANASGRVTVQVTLDEEGNVLSAKAISGHILLRNPAEAAARQSKFNPVRVNGQAVRATGTILYNFINQ